MFSFQNVENEQKRLLFIFYTAAKTLALVLFKRVRVWGGGGGGGIMVKG